MWKRFPMSEICLKNPVYGKDVFAILPTGFGESFIFQLIAQIMNVIKGKFGVSISMIIIVAPLSAIMKDQVEQLKRFGNTATAIGWGQ